MSELPEGIGFGRRVVNPERWIGPPLSATIWFSGGPRHGESGEIQLPSYDVDGYRARERHRVGSTTVEVVMVHESLDFMNALCISVLGDWAPRFGTTDG